MEFLVHSLGSLKSQDRPCIILVNYLRCLCACQGLGMGMGSWDVLFGF